MKKQMVYLLVLFFALGLLIAQSGFAAIYKYVDSDGMMYFADDLHSIPEQYRASAKIVSGEATVAEEKQPPAVTPPPAQTESKAGGASTVAQAVRTSSETGDKGTLGNRALLSVIVVVSAFFAFIVLGIVNTDHEKTVKIARIVIIWGVSVYLLYNHAKDVVHVFSMIGSSVENARQESAEKGEKAAKAIKKYNELVEQAKKAASESDAADSAHEKKE